MQWFQAEEDTCKISSEWPQKRLCFWRNSINQVCGRFTASCKRVSSHTRGSSKKPYRNKKHRESGGEKNGIYKSSSSLTGLELTVCEVAEVIHNSRIWRLAPIRGFTLPFNPPLWYFLSLKQVNTPLAHQGALAEWHTFSSRAGWVITERLCCPLVALRPFINQPILKTACVHEGQRFIVIIGAIRNYSAILTEPPPFLCSCSLVWLCRLSPRPFGAVCETWWACNRLARSLSSDSPLFLASSLCLCSGHYEGLWGIRCPEWRRM